MSRTLGDYSPWGLAPTSPHVKCGHHHQPPDTKGPLETAQLGGHGGADQLGRGRTGLRTQAAWLQYILWPPQQFLPSYFAELS